jgi:hypothetical protein
MEGGNFLSLPPSLLFAAFLRNEGWNPSHLLSAARRPTARTTTRRKRKPHLLADVKKTTPVLISTCVTIGGESPLQRDELIKNALGADVYKPVSESRL